MSSNHNVLPNASGVGIGDQANFSAVGGNQINHQNSGSGIQNNNADNGTQNFNYGRDFNINNGAAPMTINNTGRWTPSHHAISAPSPTISSASNNGPRPRSKRRLTPSRLQKKENEFKEQLRDPAHLEELVGLDGEDAQDLLNDWQLLSECTEDTVLRQDVIRAMRQLAHGSGEVPECLWIGAVENLSKLPVAFDGFADIWTGSIDRTKVALKMVRRRSEQEQHSDQTIKAFIREAMIWRDLDHPNILPFIGVHGFNRDREQICLVSPWMDNGNLLQFLKSNPEIDPKTQQTLVKDVAQGLAYLHGLRFAHGNLKGYNVLVSGARTACITGFGLARFVDDEDSKRLPTSSGRQGRARWLAPELLTNVKGSTISLEGDIYAFGCVCYEVYAKHIPFEDVEEYAIYHVVVVQNEHPQPPPDVGDDMRRLMESCWNPDPHSRPDATKILDRIENREASHTVGGSSTEAARRAIPSSGQSPEIVDQLDLEKPAGHLEPLSLESDRKLDSACEEKQDSKGALTKRVTGRVRRVFKSLLGS